MLFFKSFLPLRLRGLLRRGDGKRKSQRLQMSLLRRGDRKRKSQRLQKSLRKSCPPGTTVSMYAWAQTVQQEQDQHRVRQMGRGEWIKAPTRNQGTLQPRSSLRLILAGKRRIRLSSGESRWVDQPNNRAGPVRRSAQHELSVSVWISCVICLFWHFLLLIGLACYWCVYVFLVFDSWGFICFVYWEKRKKNTKLSR